MLKSIIPAIRRIEMALAVVLLAAIVFVVFFGTVMRYFSVPQIWTEELSQALFVWLALIGADITLQRAGHFRIDLLTAVLPDAVQLVLDIVIKIMIAALLASLVWYGLELLKVAHPRPLPILDIPSSFAAAALPVAYALMLLTTIEQIIGRLRHQKGEAVAGREVM